MNHTQQDPLPTDPGAPRARTLPIRNARCIATIDHAEPAQARELRDASIFIRGNRTAAQRLHHQQRPPVPLTQRGAAGGQHRISPFAATRTGVAHCPCSNMRLASAGVPVGLGVDGCASNDAAHMVNEARQALLLARVGRTLEPFGCDKGPSDMGTRDALAMATRGGALVPGRDDIGQIATGMCADLALFELDTLGFAGGAVPDPVGALLLCASPPAAWTVVDGCVIVRAGRLATVDLERLVARHNRLALELAQHRA